jgi:hypothetical protein
MEIQYNIEKPSYFRLRLVWGMETEQKRVAKFSDCSWLPCKGDVMILPLDENPPYTNWHQYKVNNIIYDFEHQFVRVVCRALELIEPTKAQTNFFDVDEELERVKSQLIGNLKKDVEPNQYVDTDLDALRKKLNDM